MLFERFLNRLFIIVFDERFTLFRQRDSKKRKQKMIDLTNSNIVVVDDNASKNIDVNASNLTHNEQTNVDASNDTQKIDASKTTKTTSKKRDKNSIKRVSNEKKYLSMYRENSKHAFVVSLLCRGISFDDLQKKLHEKYNNVATSNKSNVRMYISNVREKMNVQLIDHKYVIVDASNEKTNDEKND